MKKMNKEKVYRSMSEFKKDFFPNSYKKEMQEDNFLGKCLPEEFANKLKLELENQ